MLFESRCVRVTADHGTATLWLGFPGEPANALDLARLRELDAALRAVASSPFVRILVVRSANPNGFCAGIHPAAHASLVHPADRASFAWYGQQVFDGLARLDAISLAFIEGLCLGAGFELALACDRRICVAGPTAHLGFPDRLAIFGGTNRLHQIAGRRGTDLLASGETLSGREAQTLGLIDVACCERRAKIELRSFLDRLEQRPVKPDRPADTGEHTAERRLFAQTPYKPVADAMGLPDTRNPLPPLPEVIGLLGNDPHAGRLAAEVALRGRSVVVSGDRSAVFAGIAVAENRGFVTRLEAEQAWRRVRASDTLDGFDQAGLVFVAERQNPFRLAAAVRPRTVVCVVGPTGNGPLARPPGPSMPFPFPRRLLRASFYDKNRVALFPDQATDPDVLVALAAWLKPFGLTSVVFPVAAQLLPRAA